MNVQTPAARYAIYWAPAEDSLLSRLGTAWLGRDAATGNAVAQPALGGFDPARIAAITAEAARYGLHATLKAPFFLRTPSNPEALMAAVVALAAKRRPFVLPRLVVGTIGGFLALVPSGAEATLHALADDCVRAFEPFRAPLTSAELRRRRRAGLSPRQEQLLARWGYPFVFDQWRFHVTLSCRLDEDERSRLRTALAAHLAPALGVPMRVDALSVFLEPGPGLPFRRVGRLALGARPGH